MANSTNNKDQRRLPAVPLAILLLGGSCLGVAPVVVKSIDLSPEISAFYRVALSAPIFAIGAVWFARNTVLSVNPVFRLNTKGSVALI